MNQGQVVIIIIKDLLKEKNIVNSLVNWEGRKSSRIMCLDQEVISMMSEMLELIVLVIKQKERQSKKSTRMYQVLANMKYLLLLEKRNRYDLLYLFSRSFFIFLLLYHYYFLLFFSYFVLYSLLIFLFIISIDFVG